ncbi:efflux RND transporter permease subunit [uncultured Maribacter sp.]|uniref:efflux RND transporter permease subunit n=1 Tax=uncultured Maribacter sp. TaxID=431308 RepID=UPI0026187EB1|nr:efflux RND transporter permease subunit [uncultured Maribacter sp.]
MTKKGVSYKNKSIFSAFSIIIIFVTLSIIGLSLLQRIPVQLMPSKVIPTLTLRYYWSNTPAYVIEKEVTSLLEGGLSTIKGIKNIKSSSYNGSGEINLEFDEDTNMDVARFDAAAIIRNTYGTLPKQVSYPVLFNKGESFRLQPLFTYSILNNNELPNIQNIIENELTKPLQLLDGVAEVNTYGILPEQWQISYNYYKMFLNGISTNDIRAAINSAKNSYPLGTANVSLFDTSEKGLVFETSFKDNFEWEKLPIKNVNGRVIILGEIATIKKQASKSTSGYRINGVQPIVFVVYANAGIGELKFAKNVKSKIEELKKNLPPGMEILLRRDNTEFIEKELQKNKNRTVLTMGILLGFILFFTRNFKYLSIIVLSIFFNITIAFLFYYIFNVQLHIISLAGITISLGFLIDNSIVMTDHIINFKNKKVFLPLLASSLTTICSLSVIFFFDEETKLNLFDFSKVIIINLSVSLCSALFLTPALYAAFYKKNSNISVKKKRNYFLEPFYKRMLLRLSKIRVIVLFICLLLFGLPVFLLPSKLPQDNFIGKIYNQSIGSEFYNKNIRSNINLVLGGTLRLFVNEVPHGRYFTDKQETILTIKAMLPNGATLDLLNGALKKVEDYLTQFNEIKSFETSIKKSNNATITVYFKEGIEDTSFPVNLENSVLKEVIAIGSTDWRISGVGRGFNNAIKERTGKYRLEVKGYNYDQVSIYANKFKQDLLKNPRIKEANIMERNYAFRNYDEEFVLDMNQERLAIQGASVLNLYGFVKQLSTRQEYISRINLDTISSAIYLNSGYAKNYKKWNIMNESSISNDVFLKIKEHGTIKRQKTNKGIYKDNQLYTLFLEYDFIGPDQQAAIFHQDIVDKFSKEIPIGYSANNPNRVTLNEEQKTNKLIFIGIIPLLIFFVCAILFESFKLPLIVIFFIPFSMIGVFLTFYIFNLNFDQGGYAAMILLSGLTVNAVIYIINEWKVLKNNTPKTLFNASNIFQEAFNRKIVPILLTIASTIVGLIPFVLDGQKEAFWFSLAIGTGSGLIFSLLGIFFILPLFFIKPLKTKAC